MKRLTHDYTRRTWGHDFYIHEVVNGGQLLRMGGWGHGIRKGDDLLLPNGGATTRYRIREIEYAHDPSDMWHALAVFKPRGKGLA